MTDEDTEIWQPGTVDLRNLANGFMYIPTISLHEPPFTLTTNTQSSITSTETHLQADSSPRPSTYLTPHQNCSPRLWGHQSLQQTQRQPTHHRPITQNSRGCIWPSSKHDCVCNAANDTAAHSGTPDTHPTCTVIQLAPQHQNLCRQWICHHFS